MKARMMNEMNRCMWRVLRGQYNFLKKKCEKPHGKVSHNRIIYYIRDRKRRGGVKRIDFIRFNLRRENQGPTTDGWRALRGIVTIKRAEGTFTVYRHRVIGMEIITWTKLECRGRWVAFQATLRNRLAISAWWWAAKSGFIDDQKRCQRQVYYMITPKRKQQVIYTWGKYI